MPYLIGLKAIFLACILNVPIILRLRGDIFKEDIDSRFRRLLTSIQGNIIKKMNNVWIVPVSNKLGKTIYHNWNLADENVRIYSIANYVKINKLNKKNNDSNLKILSVMNMDFLDKVNGLIDFYLSASFFIKSKNVEITIVGDGPLKEYVSKQLLELDEKVKFIGKTKNIEKLYEQHDIFVHASYLDAFPSVVLEAMSFALPVIVGGYESVYEQVSNKKNGFIVSPKSNEKILHVLERLYCDANLRKQMGYASYEIVNRFFTLDVISMEWGNLLKQIDKQRGKMKYEKK